MPHLRLAACLIALSVLGACAAAGPRAGAPVAFVAADPASTIAAERAFSQAIVDDGQWAAFAAYAAEDAIMFTPDPVLAKEWLAGRETLGGSLSRQPHRMWTSCDGMLAVVQGAWQRGSDEFGRFHTVWERQPSGEYRWLVDHGDRLLAPDPVPAETEVETADCLRDSPPPQRVTRSTGSYNRLWSSPDDTLGVAVTHNREWRTLGVTIWRDGADVLVVEDTVETRPR